MKETEQMNEWVGEIRMNKLFVYDTKVEFFIFPQDTMLGLLTAGIATVVAIGPAAKYQILVNWYLSIEIKF